MVPVSTSGGATGPGVTLSENRVPILLDGDIRCPFPGLTELINGFNSVAEILRSRCAPDARAVADFLVRQAEAGSIVWRDEWSPLRWCASCDVPLLQEHCDKCGSSASGRIELEFPCNPRPVIPHDRFILAAAGLPWPARDSLVINGYRRPGLLGWELIRSGRKMGDVVQSDGGGLEFAPTEFQSERLIAPERESGPQPTMDDVVAANRSHLEAIEQRATRFIRNWCAKWRFRIPIVTYSGGKDSAVLAHLCHLSKIRMRLVHIDTGIEPLGNDEYSERALADYANLRKARISNGEMFWRAMEKLGPPALDFQWCRIVLKNSAPYRATSARVAGLLERLGSLVGLKAILIDGPRRREEPWRIALKPVVKVAGTPVETVTIRPILDFTDLDIWMYIHRHRIRVNPTYTQGATQRLVCVFCPDKDRHELRAIKEAQPELWGRFERELVRWRDVFGFPEQWVTENLWVSSEPSSQFAKDLGIVPRVDIISHRLDSVIRVGQVEELHGVFLVRAEVRHPFDLRALANWLKVLGRVKLNKREGSAQVESARGIIKLLQSGQILVTGSHRDQVAELAAVLKDWVASHVNCIGCGACKSVCRYVELKGNRAIMRPRCKECFGVVKKAIALCPVNATGLRRCVSIRQDS